jgi:hypothetical protein
VDRLPVTFSIVNLFPGRSVNPTTASLPLIHFKLGTNAPLAPASVRKQFEDESTTAAKAIDAVGTNWNCLQMLLTRLEARESPVKRTVTRWAVKLRLMKRAGLPVETRRWQAMTAIRQLGNRASPIVPQLTLLTNHSDTNISGAAGVALELIKGKMNGRKQDLRPSPPLVL